jgi:septum formation protein
MRKIILASGSPRRQDILAKMDLGFTAVPSEYEEWLDDSQSADEVAKLLAVGKAKDVAERFPAAFVIGSDVIITLKGRQLGKQPTAEAGRALLHEMSGQKVDVICSVALVCKEIGLCEVAVSKGAVRYKEYSGEAVEIFLASNDWYDKAGAVAIQSPATPPIEFIEGEYDAILGISTKLVAEMLRRQGVDVRAKH